jgi:hypothetical protein
VCIQVWTAFVSIIGSSRKAAVVFGRTLCQSISYDCSEELVSGANRQADLVRAVYSESKRHRSQAIDRIHWSAKTFFRDASFGTSKKTVRFENEADQSQKTQGDFMAGWRR